MAAVDKCKECFEEFPSRALIYPERGYPYCERCFQRCLSVYAKRAFRPKFKRDHPRIRRAIRSSERMVEALMGAITVQSDRYKRQLGMKWAKTQ